MFSGEFTNFLSEQKMGQDIIYFSFYPIFVSFISISLGFIGPTVQLEHCVMTSKCGLYTDLVCNKSLGYEQDLDGG